MRRAQESFADAVDLFLTVDQHVDHVVERVAFAS